MFNVAIGILGDFVYMSGRKPPTQSDAIMVKIPNYTENYQINFPFSPWKEILLIVSFLLKKTTPGWTMTIHRCQGMTTGNWKAHCF